jgi:hypothetical protein
MMRVFGFLSGVALTVAAFVLVLSPRDNRQPEPVTETAALPTPVELAAVVEAIAERVDVVKAANEPDRTEMAASEAQTVLEESGPDQDDHLDGQAPRETDVADLEDTDATGTYLFWSPFRSAWAAQGFAGRLTSSTQVPVEVVNAGPGNYRVAFSYQDETDRLARIERIETITGLKLE